MCSQYRDHTQMCAPCQPTNRKLNINNRNIHHLLAETLSMHLSTTKINLHTVRKRENLLSTWVSFEVAMQLLNVSVATIRHDA